jgi:hypothetical protein
VWDVAFYAAIPILYSEEGGTMPDRNSWLVASIMGLPFLLAGWAPASAQTGPARLVKDINTTQTSA